MTNQSSEPHLYLSATKDAAETKFLELPTQGYFNRLSVKNVGGYSVVTSFDTTADLISIDPV